MEKLNLTTEENKHLYLDLEQLKSIKKELEEFVISTNFSNNKNFTKEIIFPYELKNNNSIEGYNEDLTSIIKIINNPYLKANKINSEYQRIFNLYRGYDFILEKPDINENTLFKLYKILSHKLLEEDQLLLGSNLYRHSDVYIHYSSNLARRPDMGFNCNVIEKHMEELFNYINSNNNLSKVDLFIKSQIIHFYMVYIHPYFDINGRTARTTSLWFLNNNESYPYSIFNRTITYDKNKYYKTIRYVKLYKNITPFIEFISKGTKLELEKEYIIRSLKKDIYDSLSPMDKQVIQYILTNKSINTLIDIQNFYNRFNPKKNLTYINDELLLPLLEKEIILKTGYTNKKIYDNNFNYRFILNKDKFNFDKDKIKRLNINKVIEVVR